MSLLAFNPIPIIGLVITIASVAYSILGRPDTRDRRKKGTGFEPLDQPSDPTEPIRIVYGRPVWIPPVLTDYVIPSAVNSNAPDLEPGRTTVLSIGAGPIDGTDRDIWVDDVLSTENYTTETPAGQRTLQRLTPTRYLFPATNIVQDSVVIYLDSVLYAKGGDGTGGTVEAVAEESHTIEPVALQHFKLGGSLFGADHWEKADADDDDAVPGFIFPTQGIVPSETATLTYKGRIFVFWAKFVTNEVFVARLEDGTTFGWFKRPNRVSAGQMKDLTVSYRVRPVIDIEENDNGSLEAIFPTPVDSSVAVTATFKTSNLEGALTAKFLDGSRSQEEIPFETGFRKSYAVGLELSQGLVRQYTGANAITDLVVHVQSDPGGFYELSDKGSFRSTHRQLAIYLKQSAAPDQRVSGTDPSKGWIALKSQQSKSHEFHLDGRVSGQASWFFQLGPLLNFTKTGLYAPHKSLPQTKYDVQVVGLNAANAIPNQFSKLHLTSVTEVFREQFSLPRHSTLTIGIEDPDYIGREPTYTVALAGRRVWVPEATAVYDSDTMRPEPGDYKWSRNPVWCACDLITDKDFGGGQFYGWDAIDVSTAIAAAAFCDESVTLDNGVSETRAEVDIVINAKDGLGASVAKILQGAQVLPKLTGGTWSFVKDEDSESVMVLTTDNYKSGEITATFPSLEETPNEIQFTYADENMGGELVLDRMRLPSPDVTALVSRQIDLVGVRRLSQARRAASLLLNQLHLQRLQVSFHAAGWRTLLLEAGDVVTLTSPEVGCTDKKFRVTEVEYGSNLNVRITMTEHNPSVYGAGFLGPSGGVPPGLRAPTDDAATAGAQTTVSYGIAGNPDYRATVSWGLKQLEITAISKSWRINVGPLPTAASGFRAWYRASNAQSSAWIVIGDSATSIMETDKIPHTGNFEVQVIGLDENGTLAKESRRKRVGVPMLSDRSDPKDETLPAPVVRQDGPSVSVSSFLWSGADPAEYEVEVRVSETGDDEADAVDSGFHEAAATVTVTVPPDVSSAKVHTRAHRKKDNAVSNWTSSTIDIVDPAIAGVADHVADFASGTLETIDGQAVLEVNSGDLRQKSLVVDDWTTGVVDDYTTGVVIDYGAYVNGGTYTTAAVTLDEVADIELQLWPEMASVTRETRVADDWIEPVEYPTRLSGASGAIVDNRTVERSTEGLADATPIQVEWSVATSASASPTFTDSDYEAYWPGKVLPAVKTYGVRAVIKTWFGRRLTIDKLHVRRWIFCKARPWCSHSSAAELLWHYTSTAETDIDFTVAGKDFEAITFEVEWEGQGATDDTIIIEVNGSASNQVVITDAGYDVETARERVRFHLLPKVGQYRRFVIEEQYKFTDGGALADLGTVGAVKEWADSSTEITSLRFTTDGAGFAAGSKFRAWGRKDFDGA